MMRQLLADTSFLVSLVDANDIHHARAVGFLKALKNTTILLTDYVFDETMTLLKRRFGADIAVRVGQQLRESALFQILHVTEEDGESAWRIFVRYADKAWSYTDCTSLAVVQRLGLREVLAFDHHFDQMPGIVRLPPD